VKSSLENRDYSRKGYAALTMRHPLYPQKLALTSPTRGGHSVGIVRSQTKATKLVSFYSIPTSGAPFFGFCEKCCLDISFLFSITVQTALMLDAHRCSCLKPENRMYKYIVLALFFY
jgi:hypothetical protein